METQSLSSLASTPETRSDDSISGVSTIAYGFMASQACNPNLSKVEAAARNARCEADNFNSDRPEGSRRAVVVTPTFPSLLLLHQQTFFNASSMSEMCH
jgi:hypothetical protein